MRRSARRRASLPPSRATAAHQHGGTLGHARMLAADVKPPPPLLRRRSAAGRGTATATYANAVDRLLERRSRRRLLSWSRCCAMTSRTLSAATSSASAADLASAASACDRTAAAAAANAAASAAAASAGPEEQPTPRAGIAGVGAASGGDATALPSAAAARPSAMLSCLSVNCSRTLQVLDGLGHRRHLGALARELCLHRRELLERCAACAPPRPVAAGCRAR